MAAKRRAPSKSYDIVIHGGAFDGREGTVGLAAIEAGYIIQESLNEAGEEVWHLLMLRGKTEDRSRFVFSPPTPAESKRAKNKKKD